MVTFKRKILRPLLVVVTMITLLNASGTTFLPSSETASSELVLTVQTERPHYGPGEVVKIRGNLTDTNGTAIQDAKIAVEVKNPRNNTIFLDIVFSSPIGTYEDSFRLNKNTPLGEYHVYATANAVRYPTTMNQTTFIVMENHDITVTNVKPSKTMVGEGYFLSINVTVENQGDYTETFNVTVYYNETAITMPDGKNYTTTTLPSGNSTNLTLTWNTTGVAEGNYTISAHATPVPSETDIADNTYIDGVVMIIKPPRILSFHCTPNSFSPNNDGRQDTTTIRATFSTTVNWILEIRNSSGTIMRSWNGTATFKWQGAMLQQVWNGTDEAGKIVPEGTYNATLTGKDLYGTPLEPKTISLIVDTAKPIISDVSDHPDPFNPHIGQTTTINYTLSEKCHVTIKIYDPASRLIKILRATQLAGPNSMTWDGKVQGLIVPDGEYRYEIYATDMAGNEATPAIGTTTVAP